MAEQKVTIYHPVVGESQVSKSAVKAWLRRGWLEHPKAEKLDLLPVREYEEKSDTSDDTADVEE